MGLLEKLGFAKNLSEQQQELLERHSARVQELPPAPNNKAEESEDGYPLPRLTANRIMRKPGFQSSGGGGVGGRANLPEVKDGASMASRRDSHPPEGKR